MQPVFNVSGIYLHPMLHSFTSSDPTRDPTRECNQYDTHVLHKTALAGLLCDFLGTEDALVINSFAEGANLLLSCLVYGREVAVWGGPNEQSAFYSQLCSRLLDGGAKNIIRHTAPDPAGMVSGPDKTCISLCRHSQGASEQYYLAVSGRDPGATTTSGRVSVEWLEQASFVDLSSFGYAERLWVQSHVQKGADLVLFAGGGLIGGPALGFVAGKGSILGQLKGMRIFARNVVDPQSMQHFKELLHTYRDGEAILNVPVLSMLAAKEEDIRARAMNLAAVLEQSLKNAFAIEVRAGKTRLTEGNCGHFYPTYQVVIRTQKWESKAIRERLVQGRPAIIPGVAGDGSMAIDLRTLNRESDEAFAAALVRALKEFVKPAANQYIDLIPQIVWIVDRQGALVYMSKPGAAFFNLDKWGELAPGQDLDALLPPELAESARDRKDSVLESGQQERLDVEITGGNGSGNPIWLDLIVSPIANGSGEMNQVMFVASDITERKKAEDELKYMGMHDTLTGLYNRNYFEEEMKRLSSARHFPISIVICDIDGLKFINDTLGHDFGDRMLKATASILRKTFRTSDVVARIGGDEFAIILPQTDTQTAENILERAEHALKEFNETKKDIPLNLSFGMACGEETYQELMDIFKKADDTMYKNKLSRRPLQKQQVIDSLLSLMSEKGFLKEDQVGRLQQMTGLLGRYVGLSDEEVSQILLLCQVYNIGKIVLDDSTLLKAGELSPGEWEAVRRYPEVGYRITSSLPELDSVADCILQHREHWDGSGYPQGLKGEDIHLYSRILAVVDAYHAMVSPRPYREPLQHEDALLELKNNRGKQFDPRITDIFLSIMEQKMVK